MKCCVYVISKVRCTLGCVGILLASLILYCALRAHGRCKRLIKIFVYITLPRRAEEG